MNHIVRFEDQDIPQAIGEFADELVDYSPAMALYLSDGYRVLVEGSELQIIELILMAQVGRW